MDLSPVRHDSRLGARAALAAEQALTTLPLRLRLLTVVREVAGWSPARVRALTSLGPVQQAELLRESREHVARALEEMLAEGDGR